MKRLIAVLALVVPLLASCGQLGAPQAQIHVSNVCLGSWVVVKVNDVTRIPRLDYGTPDYTLSVSVGTGEIILTATGFSQTDNRPLGVATFGPFYVSNASGQITGPEQYSWIINVLMTTDGHGGCQARATSVRVRATNIAF